MGLLQAAIDQCGISPPAKLVLIILAYHAGDKKRASLSIAAISSLAGLSRSSTWRVLQDLEKRNLISIERHSGCASRYHLLLPSAETDIKTTGGDEKNQIANSTRNGQKKISNLPPNHDIILRNNISDRSHSDHGRVGNRSHSDHGRVGNRSHSDHGTIVTVTTVAGDAIEFRGSDQGKCETGGNSSEKNARELIKYNLKRKDSVLTRKDNNLCSIDNLEVNDKPTERGGNKYINALTTRARAREETDIDDESASETEPAIESEPYLDEFEEIWAIYPRKIAKRYAYRAYVARRRQGISAEDLAKAARNYAKLREGEDHRYTLHPSTFFGPNERWCDYLDVEIRRSLLPPRPKGIYG